MWPNPQETADLVTFTEEILMENLILCAVILKIDSQKTSSVAEMNSTKNQKKPSIAEVCLAKYSFLKVWTATFLFRTCNWLFLINFKILNYEFIVHRHLLHW